MKSEPPRLLADMGISLRVVEGLRNAGYDVIHAGAIGFARADDRALFSRAVDESRTVITFDLDFAEIVALTGGRHTGVIILRLRDARSDAVLRRLRVVLGACAEDLSAGALISVEDTRYRIRLFQDDPAT